MRHTRSGSLPKTGLPQYSQFDTLSRRVQCQSWSHCVFLGRPGVQEAARLCRYDEARQAYVKAGKAQASSQILESLLSCAISQRLFTDAAYYYYQMAIEVLKVREFPELKESSNMWTIWPSSFRARDMLLTSQRPLMTHRSSGPHRR
jgi:hypothetical protein